MKIDESLRLKREQVRALADKIMDYCMENFDTEIGNLEAEIMVDFITTHFGPYFYNQGMFDAMNEMKDKVDDLFIIMKDVEIE